MKDQQPRDVRPEDVKRGDAALAAMMKAGYYRARNLFSGYGEAINSGNPDNVHLSDAYAEQERQAVEELNAMLEGNDSAPAQIARYVSHTVLPAVDRFANENKFGKKMGDIGISILEKPLINAVVYANKQLNRAKGNQRIQDIIAGIGKPRGYVQEMRNKEQAGEQSESGPEEYVYPTKIIYTDESGQTYEMNMELSGAEAGSFIEMGLRVEQQRDGSLVVHGTPADATVLRCYAVIRENIFRNFDEVNQTVTLPISSGPKGTRTEDVPFTVGDILEMQSHGLRYDPKQHIFVK